MTKQKKHPTVDEGQRKVRRSSPKMGFKEHCFVDIVFWVRVVGGDINISFFWGMLDGAAGCGSSLQSNEGCPQLKRG